MPTLLSVCLEDLRTSPRFVRCVAMPGRQPGLRLDPDGNIRWKSESTPVACELWVSADERLILFRPAGAPPVEVSRAGRTLAAPLEKPVVLLTGDEILVGSRCLRVHIHGEIASAAEPSPVAERGWGAAARMAAVVAVGAVAAVAGCERKIDVREQPPEPMPVPKPTTSKPAPAPPPPPTTSRPAAPTATNDPDIEVRVQPPEVEATPKEKKR